MFFVVVYDSVVCVIWFELDTDWELVGRVSSNSSKSLKKSAGISSSLTVGVCRGALMGGDCVCLPWL